MRGTTLLIAALATALPLAGCIDAIRGEDDELGANAEGTGSVELLVSADNVPEDVDSLTMTLAAVFVHDQDVDAPDGFFELDVSAAHVQIVTDGSAARIAVAAGDVPAGTYDQVLLRVDDFQREASTDATGSAGGFGGMDMPIGFTFDVEADRATQVELVFDGAADPGDVANLIERVVISRDGQVVATKTGVTVATGTTGGPVSEAKSPPVARVSIFAPDGALSYKASFLAPDDEFANDAASAFPSGEDVSFSGSASEAVEAGSSLSTYAWDFDDGTSATGLSATHAFAAPGVYEVKLTVTDSFGTDDTQVVRVIVKGGVWTATLANESFEEGAGDWTVDVAGTLGLSDWAVEGPGRDSEMAFHAATALPSPTEVVAPYTPLDNTTLHSPEFAIPAGWSSAGFQFYLSGSAQSLNQIFGPGALHIWYTVDGEVVDVVTIPGGALGWTAFGDSAALSGAIGKTVQFHFEFTTADPAAPSDAGWFVDDFAIGGVDLPVHKPALLEQVPGHGGPGHHH